MGSGKLLLRIVYIVFEHTEFNIYSLYCDNPETMSTKEKQRKRAENKKRKITALLAVAELNDADIKRRKVQSM